MNDTREWIRAVVTEKAERSLLAGHPWVFGEEIVSLGGEPDNGALVDVTSRKGSYLGTGFYNANSKIRIRVLSRNANDRFDDAFFYRRVKYAYEYRKTVLGNDFDCFRLIFGEADSFPGLTVDLFHDVLVVQTLSYGLEIRKEMIFGALLAVLKEDGVAIRGIYERNDVSVRRLEGLPEGKGWYRIPDDPRTTTEITENGIRYLVDFENGQKTGFFLDQKYNRLLCARIAAGKSVLDCFTHTGSFALNAVRGGAAQVTAVDISETAIRTARENARRNGMEDCIAFVVEDAFETLRRMEAEKRKFDFVILDPPAFTKSRKTIDSAMRGYQEINYRGMKLVARGGYFATCSCSHFAYDDAFRQMLGNAARQAGVSLRQIEARKAAPDHPVLWNVPETDYLKFYLFQIV